MPMPKELVMASKPWSISIGMPWVPSRFMLKPQAKRPSTIFQNGHVRIASAKESGSRRRRRAAWAAPAAGSTSAWRGASSRKTKIAAGTATAANSAAKRRKVALQPNAPIDIVNSGVMIAMPAIEPVERKKSAMPRCRLNQRAMRGVNATWLVKPRPIDSRMPKVARKASGARATTVPAIDAMTIAVPARMTTRVPMRPTR